ncbi:S1C family serine protease [Chitinimonas lacunae]|uniref:S1C family serine protease n=1 Tax=Chitinimonas lacunae TaxID=1963018 RepID=A0ABV8MS89_9NEIS
MTVFPRLFSRLLYLALLLLGASGVMAVPTEEVFSRYKDRIVQVRILDVAAGTRVGYGSGFAATQADRIVTNFHVIAPMIHAPDHHRIELQQVDGRSMGAELVGFDAVRDLAVLRPSQPLAGFFPIAEGDPPKGMRLFSFGVPNDLDFTIVEGTYNGLIGNSLYDRIHFTGAINSGMSGGPVIDGDGRIVGVNVATESNSVGFLVPGADVRRLLAQPVKPPSHWRDQLRDQLLAHQEKVMAPLIGRPLPGYDLGRYRLPGRFAQYLRCWADARRRDTEPFQVVSQLCHNEDAIFVSDSLMSGQIRFRHDLLEAPKLDRFRFARLYQRYLETGEADLGGDQDEVGNFVCQQNFVQSRGPKLKAVLCLRGYRRLTGLYDLFLRVASLDRHDEGMVSTLVISGVSYRNAMAFSKHYLEQVQWKR